MSDATWQSGNWWEPLTEMIQAKMEETKRRWEQERDARERTAFRHQSRFEHRKSPEDWPFGPGPGPFGPGFPFGPGWGKGFAGPRRGPRRARGDVRDAVLALLSEQPMHGYQIIQEISRRSGDAWRPAPARSTRRSPSWRTRAWSAPSSPRAAASSTSPTRAARTSSPTPTSSAPHLAPVRGDRRGGAHPPPLRPPRRRGLRRRRGDAGRRRGRLRPAGGGQGHPHRHPPPHLPHPRGRRRGLGGDRGGSSRRRGRHPGLALQGGGEPRPRVGVVADRQVRPAADRRQPQQGGVREDPRDPVVVGGRDVLQALVRVALRVAIEDAVARRSAAPTAAARRGRRLAATSTSGPYPPLGEEALRLAVALDWGASKSCSRSTAMRHA